MSRDREVHSRRAVLASGAAGALALAVVPLPAAATPAKVMEEIKKLYGDRAIAEGRITLDLPSIAENGLAVPMSFEVESPMTETDYVKAVHFFAEGNPSVSVASYHFSPMSPKAAASLRIRLAQSQNIIAVAEMSNAQLYTARKEVKVTIGGCSG